MLPENIFVTVVNRGQSDTVLQLMQGFGLAGGVVLLGEGTVFNKWLEILGLNESQKDVVLMPISKDYDNTLHELMLKNFKIHKKHRGIAFSLPLSQFQHMDYFQEGTRPDPEDFDFICLITILDQGQAKDCVKIAREEGASGGTLIRARGAGVPQDNIFDLLIEPQKDLVFFIVPQDQAQKIQDHLVERMELELEGRGVIFSLPVSRATGLYQERKED